MASMTYEISATSRFKRDLDSFDETFKTSIKKELEILKANPYSGKRLHGNLKGFLSLRIGKYRAVYSVDDNSRKVILYFFGHRKGIYDK